MSNLPTALANLTWTHNCILKEKVKEYEKRIWYAKECIENGYLYVTGDYVNYLNECLNSIDVGKEKCIINCSI